MDLQNFEKIKLPIAANIGAGLFGLIVPGFLIVFIWDGALFERLDFWKLFMLSLAICLPAFLLPFGLSGLFHRIISHGLPHLVSLWGAPVDWYLRHAFNNAINIYTVIFFAWLFDLSIAGVVWGVVSMAVWMALLELFHFWFFKKNPSALYSVWFLLEPKKSITENDAPSNENS